MAQVEIYGDVAQMVEPCFREHVKVRYDVPAREKLSSVGETKKNGKISAARRSRQRQLEQRGDFTDLGTKMAPKTHIC
jgi:hypothetical protein